MEIDYPEMVWDMFVTDEAGKKLYAGMAQTADAANALLELLVAECGFTNPEKRHIAKGNHGYYTLEPTPWPLPRKQVVQ